jgi:peptidoglycan/xylan/chitin deacetylase (PgdA/CDA1 family)
MSAMRHLWGAVRRRAKSDALILMYHRVAESESDPWQLCVTPEMFERQLDWLSRQCRVISLRELVAELRAGRRRSHAVAITFDDGYADNLINAAPLLAKYGLPATFFLTTASLGATREFWWDELERLLLLPASLPPVLHITVGEQSRSFNVGTASVSEIPHERPWEAPAGTRLGLYYTVWSLLRPLDDAQRQSILADLRRQLDVPEIPRESHRTLQLQEVKLLAARPGNDIGAHSVTHSAFSERSPTEQRREMEQSKREIETLLQRPVWGFAYPYGAYSAESAEIARDVGYEFACTTENKTISRGTSLHLLPRLAVESWDQSSLASKVSGALE